MTNFTNIESILGFKHYWLLTNSHFTLILSLLRGQTLLIAIWQAAHEENRLRELIIH